MSTTDPLRSSAWGIARGLCVQTLIYPLEVVKIRQQCHPTARKGMNIARTILSQEGIGACYQGLSPQLIKTSIKQAWVWPLITGIPACLQRRNAGETQQQVLTGLSIASIDAAVTTPLERLKIQSAFAGKRTSSTGSHPWKGFTAHWSKSSVGWVSFLVAQKQLRDRSRKAQEQELSLDQLAGVGIQVAAVVSAVSAPFDVANTLKQAQNHSPARLLREGAVHKLYRGWPLQFFALTLQNITSVALIDYLGKPCGKTRS